MEVLILKRIPVEELDKRKFLFGSIFLLSNRLQALGDQSLMGDDLTLRQWFLTVMILQFDEAPGPTLGEVAKLMGTSHQNVKQLALKLRDKDFLSMDKDASDGRMLRLRLTDKSRKFWDGKEEEQNQFIETLFQQTTNEEVQKTASLFQKIFKTIEDFDASKETESKTVQK